MTQADRLQRRIDAYLAELRRCLGELPSEEVHDILQEIRGHILERTEASGELSEERLVDILKALGRPEEIAPLYQVDSVVAKARVSLSPRIVLRGIHRWSVVSGWGLVIFIIGIVGYSTGFSLMLSALAKFIWPDRVGAWIGGGHFVIGTISIPGARDVLGWWLVPIGLAVGALIVLGTMRLLRWTLRFAHIKRPTRRSEAA
jgi:uncharacterized membrane protein